jgi:hypothetical protein
MRIAVALHEVLYFIDLAVISRRPNSTAELKCVVDSAVSSIAADLVPGFPDQHVARVAFGLDDPMPGAIVFAWVYPNKSLARDENCVSTGLISALRCRLELHRPILQRFIWKFGDGGALLGRSTTPEPAMSRQTHRFASNLFIEASNGVCYAYRRFGNAVATPLVVLSHFRGMLDCWDSALIEALSREREVTGSHHVVLEPAEISRHCVELFAPSSRVSALANLPTISGIQAMFPYDRNPL